MDGVTFMKCYVNDLMGHLCLEFFPRINLNVSVTDSLLNYDAKFPLQGREILIDVFCPFCVGLVHEDCLTKMRLLSLVDLASSESGQIPYPLIEDTLSVRHFSTSICF